MQRRVDPDEFEKVSKTPKGEAYLKLIASIHAESIRTLNTWQLRDSSFWQAVMVNTVAAAKGHELIPLPPPLSIFIGPKRMVEPGEKMT